MLHMCFIASLHTTYYCSISNSLPPGAATWELARLLASASAGVAPADQWLPHSASPPPQESARRWATLLRGVSLELQLPGMGSPTAVLWPVAAPPK